MAWRPSAQGSLTAKRLLQAGEHHSAAEARMLGMIGSLAGIALLGLVIGWKLAATILVLAGLPVLLRGRRGARAPRD